jgi:small subunit ribosomal protein S3
MKQDGQKMNPLGFRLDVTQNHHSYWFAQPKNLLMRKEQSKKVFCIIYA